MRQAKFKRVGKLVICSKCSHVWRYRGKRRSGWITCPNAICASSIRLEDSRLPTAEGGKNR